MMLQRIVIYPAGTSKINPTEKDHGNFLLYQRKAPASVCFALLYPAHVISSVASPAAMLGMVLISPLVPSLKRKTKATTGIMHLHNSPFTQLPQPMDSSTTH